MRQKLTAQVSERCAAVHCGALRCTLLLIPAALLTTIPWSGVQLSCRLTHASWAHSCWCDASTTAVAHRHPWAALPPSCRRSAVVQAGAAGQPGHRPQ